MSVQTHDAAENAVVETAIKTVVSLAFAVVLAWMMKNVVYASDLGTLAGVGVLVITSIIVGIAQGCGKLIYFR